jgi:hypothetical protein
LSGAIIRRVYRIAVVDNDDAARREHVMDPRQNVCDWVV